MSEQRRTISIVEAAPSKTLLQKLLDGVETVGNKVPHPAGLGSCNSQANRLISNCTEAM